MHWGSCTKRTNYKVTMLKMQEEIRRKRKLTNSRITNTTMNTIENEKEEDTSQTVHSYGLEVGESITFPIHQKKVSWVAVPIHTVSTIRLNGGHFHVL